MTVRVFIFQYITKHTPFSWLEDMIKSLDAEMNDVIKKLYYEETRGAG